jgi:hypothetical protein
LHRPVARCPVRLRGRLSWVLLLVQ